ncbi:arginase family protein [Bacillus cereus]|nr:arginase family protein [Bacillus cereus]
MNKYYRVKKSLIIKEELNYLTLWDSKEGWEINVEQSFLECIRAFYLPITRDAAYKLLLNRFDLTSELLDSMINSLLEQGIIEEFTPEAETFRGGKGGMFNSEVVTLSECMNGTWCNIAFIGMPYDLNVTYRPGCRFAPRYLRKVSGAVYQHNSQSLCGVYDPIKGKKVFENVAMADIGDIQSIVFARNGKEFDALEETVFRLVNHNVFPVTIGGDHSITLPCLKGIGRAKKIGVIQLDAHSDFGLNKLDNWRDSVHHGNFIDAVLEEEGIEEVIQVGIRQLVETQLTHEKVKQWPGKSILNNLNEFGDVLNKELQYYITLDVDVFDSAVIKSTGTPLPGGFSYDEMIEILEFIVGQVEIIGLDIVELLPEESEIEGITISRIIINILSNIMERKYEYLSRNTTVVN